MPWTEVSSSHFQPTIGEHEYLLKILGDSGHALGHEHWAINVDATLNPKPTADGVKRFEKAWKTLRFYHPSIAAVASESHIDYEVPDSTSLNAWAAENFLGHEDAAPEAIAAAMRPTPLTTLHIFPKAGQVLLHTSHWRTDGVGVLHRARKPHASHQASKSGGGKVDRYLLRSGGAVGIECSAAQNTLPAGTRAVKSAFSEATTNAIVKACKNRLISVTSAVHAALASTNWAFAAEDDKFKHYTSTIRCALRPYLPEPYRGPKYAAGLYTSAYMFALSAGQSFEKSTQHGIEDMIRNAPADPPPQTDVDISSLGIIDRMVQSVHGDFEVVDVNLELEILTRQMGFLGWTFKGKLTFSLVYNEAFYPAQTAVAFSEHLKQKLTLELGAQE